MVAMNDEQKSALALKEQLIVRYSGSSWYKNVELGQDDGGPLLHFYVTDFKEALVDGLKMHFGPIKVCFISVGKPASA